MDQHHLEVIQNDEQELRAPLRRFAIRLKLAWYAVSRPLMSAYLKRLLKPALAVDPVFRRVDRFLNGDGGMFKEYVYARCSRFIPIRGASVLVPGVGYGKNLLQLAAAGPREIVAFDLFDYPEVWAMLKEKIEKEYGVRVTFLKGDFEAVPEDRKNTFDIVISDAVLEHVPDMPKFARMSNAFLRPGGVFYASFGPLWYGPSGDHVTWGADRLFDHLLLSKEAYEEQLREELLSVVDKDSCDPGFMIEQEFFSYVKGVDYLAEMDKAGFEMIDVEAKVSRPAISLLRSRPELNAALDAAGVPAFDRYSAGMYFWARKS